MRYFSFFIFLLGVIFFPNHSFAEEIIGFSPPIGSYTVYEGDILHVAVYLSHSDLEHSVSFSVSQEFPTLINIHNQNTFSIPVNEHIAPFPYDIDATNISIGEYDENLKFILQDSQDSSEINGSRIRYGLTEKIHVSVVARPDATETITMVDYPSLVSDISPSLLRSHQDVYSNSDRDILVSWNLDNVGKNPLSGVESRVEIRRNGLSYASRIIEPSDIILLNEPLVQSTKFSLDRFAPSGRYDVALTVGDKTIHSAFWVIQKPLMFKIGIGVFGGMFVVVGYWFVHTKKQKRGLRH